MMSSVKTNREDPDQKLRSVASNPGLHMFVKVPFANAQGVNRLEFASYLIMK